MAMNVRPLLLVADKNVSVTVDKTADDGPAYVQQFGTKGFKIVINDKVCREMWKKSWLFKKIDYDEFLCGILLHEVSHIKYGTFVRPPVINGMFHLIDNILEDSRIEYNLTFEHPALARYIRWILVALRRGVDKVKAPKQKEVFKRIDRNLDTLYTLTRFGTITKKADPEFVAFSLPLILSSTRGNRVNTHIAAKAIYDYLLDIAMEDPEVKQWFENVQDFLAGITLEEIKDILGQDQVASSNSLNVAKQTAIEGKLAGSGGDPVTIEEKENSFYRSTVEKRQVIISQLRNIFKRYFEKASWVSDFDGDMNVMRQQNAYINSMTNDVGMDYVRMLRKDPSLDVLVLRDISSSTSSIKDSYAETAVVQMAALEMMAGVRTCMVDFGDSHAVIKAFEEDMTEARLFPRAKGGTVLMPALEEARNFKWRAKNRLAFVITDGYISSFDECVALMNKMEEQQGIEFKMFNIDPGGPEEPNLDEQVIHCQLESLPFIISEMVLKRYRRR